ncbi:MAG: DMT family transporter [Candidatus Puniceispirillaceae bacterium]
MMMRIKNILSPELYGGLLILLAMSILGLSDNFFYYLEPHMGLGQFHAGRSFVSVILLLPFAYITGTSLMPHKWRPVLGRTILQTLSMFLYFGSLPLMSVAEAAAGLFTSPIFVLIFTSLIYKERIGIRRITAVAIGTLGVFFVLRPDQAGFHISQTMPVAAGALYALASMTTRRWCADEPPLAIVTAFLVVIGLTGALATTLLDIYPVSAAIYDAAPFFFRGWQPMDMPVWGWMIIQAAMSLIAIAFLTMGYQVAETSYMAVFEYSLLIFAAFWTYLLFGDTLALTSIIGFVFIAGAGIIISRALPSLPQD